MKRVRVFWNFERARGVFFLAVRDMKLEAHAGGAREPGKLLDAATASSGTASLCAQRAGKSAEAIADLRTVLEIDPNHQRAKALLQHFGTK